MYITLKSPAFRLNLTHVERLSVKSPERLLNSYLTNLFMSYSLIQMSHIILLFKSIIEDNIIISIGKIVGYIIICQKRIFRLIKYEKNSRLLL